MENISKVDSVYRILNDATSKGGGNSGTLNGTSPTLEQNSSSASSSLQKSTTSSPQPTVVSAAVSWFITINNEHKSGAILFKQLYNHTTIRTQKHYINIKQWLKPPIDSIIHKNTDRYKNLLIAKSRQFLHFYHETCSKWLPNG